MTEIYKTIWFWPWWNKEMGFVNGADKIFIDLTLNTYNEHLDQV